MTGSTGAPSLRSLDLADRYRSDNEDVVAGFYVPALSVSVSYSRAVGYFTSTSLALFARGIREFADGGVSPYRAMKNKQLSAAIDRAVQNLPPDYRELIQLRHFAELSYEEIATMKKLPLGTVKNKLFRARNLLKEALGGFLEPL